VEAENLATVDLTRVFTPDAVLPVQLVSSPAEGWLQRLCLAIFDDALKCLEGRLRDRRQAWAWVLSDADYCFSFTAVCAVLNLDAGSVRRQLRQCFEGSARQAGVSRQLRQPLSRAPSARGRSRSGKERPVRSDPANRGMSGH
jgi:hypothetical protein